MRYTSLFQSLPELVVKRMLAFLDNKRNHIPNSNWKDILPVLHSCSFWRALLVEQLFDDVEILVADEPVVGVNYPRWPRDIALPLYPVESFVKKVRLSYRHRAGSHLNGSKTLDMLRIDDGFRFLHAFHLDLSIKLDFGYETEETLERLDETLSKFWKLIPHINSITIDCNNVDYYLKEDYPLFFTQRVFSKAKGIPKLAVLNFDCYYLDNYDFIDNFTGLTEFHCNQVFLDEICYHIIQRNAGTLKELHIENQGMQHTKIMLINGGEPVIYPKLETLSIVVSCNTKSKTAAQYDHFPVLKKLCILALNLDFYELLFNNSNANHRSLEYLELQDSADFFKQCPDHYVFSHRQLRSLKTMVFHFRKGFASGAYAANESKIQFIGLIMDGATELSRLKINGTIERDLFVDMVVSQSGFAVLREIKISNIELYFADIVLLVKKTPNLCVLYTSIKDNYPSIDNVEPDGLMEYVETNYVDLGKSLRRLHLTCVGGNMYLDNFCMSLVLLASICPNLVYVLVRGFEMQALKTHISKLFGLEEISEYGGLLESIVKTLVMSDEEEAVFGY